MAITFAALGVLLANAPAAYGLPRLVFDVDLLRDLLVNSITLVFAVMTVGLAVPSVRTLMMVAVQDVRALDRAIFPYVRTFGACVAGVMVLPLIRLSSAVGWADHSASRVIELAAQCVVLYALFTVAGLGLHVVSSLRIELLEELVQRFVRGQGEPPP